MPLTPTILRWTSNWSAALDRLSDAVLASDEQLDSSGAAAKARASEAAIMAGFLRYFAGLVMRQVYSVLQSVARVVAVFFGGAESIVGVVA